MFDYKPAHYILDENLEPVLCEDPTLWTGWFFNTDRRVQQDDFSGVCVSTIFLGLDHQFGDGPPLLYETMVFGGKYDQWCRRHPTRMAALAYHDQMVTQARLAARPWYQKTWDYLKWVFSQEK